MHTCRWKFSTLPADNHTSRQPTNQTSSKKEQQASRKQNNKATKATRQHHNNQQEPRESPPTSKKTNPTLNNMFPEALDKCALARLKSTWHVATQFRYPTTIFCFTHRRNMKHTRQTEHWVTKLYHNTFSRLNQTGFRENSVTWCIA